MGYGRGEKRNKAAMLATLQTAPVKAKLAGCNTLDYTRADGARVIRLHDTDILTLLPSGGFVINTGGWNTVTTRARLNDFLPGDWRVHTAQALLYLSNRKTGESCVIQRIASVDKKGRIKSDLSEIQTKALIKMIDNYMQAWRKRGLPSADDSGGDPWVFPDDGGKIETSVVIDWLKTKYVHRLLYVLACRYAGLNDTGIGYYMYGIDQRGGKLDKIDYSRIRRYIRACVGLAA